MTSRISRFSSLAAFGVVALLGAVAWTGCGPGSETRAYCDSTGCYTCDAYGCSSASPSPQQGCTGPNCAATDAGAPSTVPDSGTVTGCTTKADCGTGKACVSGTCEACGGTAGPCPCTAATDCSASQQCISGACTDTKNTCKYSSECESGKVCANGQCLASCETTTCGTGFTCEKGVCQPTVEPPTCASDAQCTAEAPHCVAGTCQAACTEDGQCGTGNYCNQGACVVDTRPKPNCTDDNQCGGTSATPKKCLGGFCKYTCTSNDYCRTIDSRIGYCAQDGVCRTAAEAGAECLSTADCTGGKACIDNQCK